MELGDRKCQGFIFSVCRFCDGLGNDELYALGLLVTVELVM